MTTNSSGIDASKLNNDELKKALEECIMKDMPLSAEPLFAESISRARAAGNYVYLKELLINQIALNNERYEDDDYFRQQLDSLIKAEATPLRQMLCLEATDYCQYSDNQSKLRYLIAAIDNSDGLLTQLPADTISDKLNSSEWGTAFTLLSAMAAGKLLDINDDFSIYRSWIGGDNDDFDNEETNELPKLTQQDFLNSWRATIDKNGGELDSLFYSVYTLAQKLKLGQNADDILAQMRQTAHTEQSINLLNYTEAFALMTKAEKEKNVAESDKLVKQVCQILETVKYSKILYTILPNAQRLFKSLTMPSVSIETENTLAPNTFVPIFLTYRNIENIELRYYRNPKRINGSKAAKEILDNQKPIRTETIKLPKVRRIIDNNTAYYESEGFESGKYMVAVFADGKDLMATRGFFVNEIRAISTSEATQRNIMAVNAISGKPLLDAKINGKKVDQMGVVKINDSSQDITIDHKNERFKITEYFYSHNSKDGEIHSAMVLTDRNIYRPEQTIMYKIVAYKATLNGREVVPNSTLRIRLEAYNGTLLGEEKLTTNMFGSVAGEFTIPADAPLGVATMDIYDLTNHCRLDNYSIRIEEYKRKNNSLTFEPITDMLVMGDDVKILARASDASGLPLAGCTVECLKAENNNKLTPFDTLSTNNKGEILITVPTNSNESLCDCRILCKLTDLKGETLEASTRFTVNKRGYNFFCETFEKVSEGQNKTIALSCNNTFGQPHKSRMKVEIIRLDGKGEIFAKPQNDYYDYQRAVDTIIGNRLSLDVNGKLSKTTHAATLWSKEVEVEGHKEVELNCATLATGRYAVRCTGVFANGENFEQESQFVVFAASDKPSANLDILMLDAPHKIAPGQKLSARIGTGLNDQTITLSFSGNNQLLQKQIHIGSEMRTVEFDVPSDICTSNILLSATMVRDNRFYERTASINIIRPEPTAKIELETKRNASEPGKKETWTLRTDAAEVAASMYDARLDKFTSNLWSNYLSRKDSRARLSSTYRVSDNDTYGLNHTEYNYPYSPHDINDFLRAFFEETSRTRIMVTRSRHNDIILEEMAVEAVPMQAKGMPMMKSARSMADMAMADSAPMSVETEPVEEESDINGEQPSEPLPRTDFRETVFFAPQLTPDSTGRVSISFELPDNITTYIFRARGHKKDMALANCQNKLEVRKSLTIEGGWPRFLRASDRISIAATITAADKDVKNAECSLTITDKVSGKEIGSYKPMTVHFAAAAQRQVAWTIDVPENISEIQVSLRASTNGFADVEQKTLPILPSAVEVNESETFVLMNPGQHTIENPYNEATTRQLSFSYTANTFMHVLRALPSLNNKWGESTDTYVGRIESNSLAILLSQNGDLKKAVQNLNALGDAISNAELTPWRKLALSLRDHDSEVSKMLLSDNKMETISESLNKLQALQSMGGGISWFKGMDESGYLTSYVIGKFGELQKLGLLHDKRADQIITRGHSFVVKHLHKEYSKAQSIKNEINFALWHADDLLSLALTRKDSKLDKKIEEMISLVEKHWPQTGTFNRITIARLMHEVGRSATAKEIAESLRQNLVRDKDLAHVSEKTVRGWSAPLKANAELIMLFQTLGSEADLRDVKLLTNWLIVQKRGDYWPDRECTSRAVLALLGNGKTFAHTDVLSVAGERIALTTERPHIVLPIADHSTPAAVIEKTGDLPSWGAWTRINATPIAQMKPADCNEMSIERKLFVRRGAAYTEVKAGTPLHVGDVLKVQLTISTSSNLSFVQVTDYRASAQEPVDFVSSYRGFCWWGPGTPHYFSPADTRATFYIYDLLRGKHTFAYETTITQSGTLTAGYAEAQCLFDPDIVAHSDGKLLKVD